MKQACLMYGVETRPGAIVVAKSRSMSLPKVRRLFAHVEARLLALWIGLVAAVWAFLALASELREGELTSFDTWVLLAFRHPNNPHQAVGPIWLTDGMRDITSLGSVTVLFLITAIAALILYIHDKKRHAAVLGAAIILSQLSDTLLKNFYGRVRPAFAVYGTPPVSLSFPSGHSTTATTAYFVLAMIAATLEVRTAVKVIFFAIAALLALSIGFSRVFLGVHWPSDVMAGWCVGGFWALAASLVLSELNKHAR